MKKILVILLFQIGSGFSQVTLSSTQNINIIDNVVTPNISCIINKPTIGNNSFTYSCGGTALSGSFTPNSSIPLDYIIINYQDLFIMVLTNSTSASWGINPNSSGTPTFTIPANSLGIQCISKSQSPSNIVSGIFQ